MHAGNMCMPMRLILQSVLVIIDRIANTASEDVCNRVTMLNELLQWIDGMLCLSDDSFSSSRWMSRQTGKEQQWCWTINIFFMHQLMTLPPFFFSSEYILNVNWYYVRTWHVPSVRNKWWLIDWLYVNANSYIPFSWLSRQTSRS